MSARAPRPAGWCRRDILGVALAAVGLSGLAGRPAGAGGTATAAGWPTGAAGTPPGGAGTNNRRRHGDELADLSPFERLHYPVVRLPVVTANGDRVPIAIEMTHPMEAAHHVESVAVVNARDPVPSKGLFHFTPASGQVYVAFQARLDAGPSEVAVTARCSVHGDFTTLQPVTVADGQGGCAAPAPAAGKSLGTEPLPPRLRLPQLLRAGRIQPDEVIDVQLSMRHPNRTGLAYRDGRFVVESPPFHLESLVARFAGEPVCRFELTSALGDDPLISFRLRAGRGGVLQVLLANNRGGRFDASARVEVS